MKNLLLTPNKLSAFALGITLFLSIVGNAIPTAEEAEVKATPYEPWCYTCGVETQPSDHPYWLKNDERRLIEEVVEAEAGTEKHIGKCAIAQCILEACLQDGLTPSEVIDRYLYTTERKEPSEDTKKAVSEVFDKGFQAIHEPIKYFYAPAVCTSDWHEENLTFVCYIGNHKFFKEATHE